jgi:hypothetical protein
MHFFVQHSCIENCTAMGMNKGFPVFCSGVAARCRGLLCVDSLVFFQK